ncbi:sortase, partial [Streptococcus oralis]
DLDKMKVGDKFFIQNIAETLAYEVDSITVIEPTQFDSLNIVPDKDYVTLLTCTPYMINSHRLLVRGHRIPYKPSEEKVKNPISHISIPPLYLVVFAILFLIFIILAWNKWKSKKA